MPALQDAALALRALPVTTQVGHDFLRQPRHTERWVSGMRELTSSWKRPLSDQEKRTREENQTKRERAQQELSAARELFDDVLVAVAEAAKVELAKEIREGIKYGETFTRAGIEKLLKDNTHTMNGGSITGLSSDVRRRLERRPAANPLSPDVLGDQKDKGKAAEYADSKESGSVTNEVIPVPTEEADHA
jgi:hypothetical protein